MYLCVSVSNFKPHLVLKWGDNMDQLINLVGMNIKEIRKQKNMTQEELAEKCGLQTSYLAGVERGDRNITLQTLEKIVAGLEINSKELFEVDLAFQNLSLEIEQLISVFTNQLKKKSEQEILLVLRIANDIFETYKKS